jgi:hypothetical protein
MNLQHSGSYIGTRLAQTRNIIKTSNIGVLTMNEKKNHTPVKKKEVFICFN